MLKWSSDFQLHQAGESPYPAVTVGKPWHIDVQPISPMLSLHDFLVQAEREKPVKGKG